MITARATGEDGQEVLLLGVTRENIRRLTAGQPIRVSAETHPGFPDHLRVLIVFGETERTLAETLKPFIGEQTKVIAVPREKGRTQ